jgi:heat shock protein HslJ
MKPQIFSLLLIAALLMSCASDGSLPGPWSSGGNTSNPPAAEINDRTAANVSGIEGNEWKLIEVYVNGRNTRFSRNTLPEELKNFFTVNFDAQNVSGVGAPNRYSAPYTKGDNQTINIMLIRSTMMATFLEPENLTEHDFFRYMQNAHNWELINNNLELFSRTETGGDVRLVFSL